MDIEELKERLSIDADFSGWDYGDRDNRLTIRLCLDDVCISETSLCIEPVGFKRDDD